MSAYYMDLKIDRHDQCPPAQPFPRPNDSVHSTPSRASIDRRSSSLGQVRRCVDREGAVREAGSLKKIEAVGDG